MAVFYVKKSTIRELKAVYTDTNGSTMDLYSERQTNKTKNFLEIKLFFKNF